MTYNPEAQCEGCRNLYEDCTCPPIPYCPNCHCYPCQCEWKGAEDFADKALARHDHRFSPEHTHCVNCDAAMAMNITPRVHACVYEAKGMPSLLDTDA